MFESNPYAQTTCNEIPRVNPVRYPLQLFDLELEIKQSSVGLFTFTGLLRTCIKQILLSLKVQELLWLINFLKHRTANINSAYFTSHHFQ